MQIPSWTIVVPRRAVLRNCAAAGLGIAGVVVGLRPQPATADDVAEQDRALIEQLTGRVPTQSSRIRLDMPPVFGNGYSVPLTFAVDSPMTDSDHVTSVIVVAPRNPIVTVARFRFTPQSGRAGIATRIRLAQPQTVLAVAEMSDGSLLMAGRWVKVDTDGCT